MNEQLQIKRYGPNAYKPYEKITMVDAESYYCTSFKRQEDGFVFILTAPLLVCMALHGKVEELLYLRHKYPLLDICGWSPELDIEEKIQKKAFFYGMDKTGKCVFQETDPIGTTFALVFSNVENCKEFEQLYMLAPLSEKDKIKIDRIADKYTKYRLAYMLQKYMESHDDSNHLCK